ncbi:unnamed protein product, partial [Strongylus vulgaris]
FLPVFEDEALLEAALCTEVVLCVLDTLETIIRVISMPGSDHLHFALPMVLRVMMHMFACNQSVQALECIFVSQRTLVKKFSDVIFEQVNYNTRLPWLYPDVVNFRKPNNAVNYACNCYDIVPQDYQQFDHRYYSAEDKHGF